MKNRNHIPKNTNDMAAVEELREMPFKSVIDDVPILLEWLQDGHWEVAEGIAEYLVAHVNRIAKELIFVLNTDDAMWKYFVICGLIARSKEKLSPDLIKILRRIAENPSKMDAEDGVDDVAKDLIANEFLCG